MVALNREMGDLVVVKWQRERKRTRENGEREQERSEEEEKAVSRFRIFFLPTD